MTNAFCYKDRIPKELTSGVVCKSQFGLCNETYYYECVGHLNSIIGDLIGISPLTNPLSVNPTKWLNTLKQYVGKLPTNCLSVFDHFVGLALKEIRKLRLSKGTADHQIW